LIIAPGSLSFTENEQVDGFIVVFKPYGFSDLFRINTLDTTDYFPDFSSIKGKEARILYEQLIETKGFSEKIKIANQYFLKKIPRRDNSSQIREACKQIMKKDGLVNIKALAYDTNMSLSSLERQFTKRVGVSPKMFARFKRFHRAVSLMNPSKQLSFSQVAYQSGYYDPAHFSKEFEAFTGPTPSSFCAQQFPLYQQLVLGRNYYTLKNS
jgi:AraC-like DNA-binding protein